MHNKIIILTDGYLQFDKSITTKRAKGTYMTGLEKLRNKPNWEAVFAAQKLKLNACPNPIENTEVLVLEIAPQNKSVNTNEIQIIQKFWKTWFNDMHLKSDIFDTNDGDINKGKINEFLMK